MKKWTWLSRILLLALLAGCGPLALPPETPTPPRAPTSPGPGPRQATLTPTAPLDPTAFATATPTRIAETPTATPNATAAAIALQQAIMAMQQPRLDQPYPAPDGKWQAQVVIYDCVRPNGLEPVAYEQLQLTQVARGSATTADDQLRYCEGLGAFGLAGRFWSPNSRYFYYTSAREGVPDGGCAYWEPPFLRLDASTLNKVNLGAGPRSPDGGKLATWQGRDLVVWDIDEGEVGRVPALALEAVLGPIAWSPDSRALVYVQATSACPAPGIRSYVVRVDLPKLEPILLLESQAPSFGGVQWDRADELRLFDEKGKEWRYNFRTQGLNPVP